MSKTILTLSTYPIDCPSHGGQIRLHNIVQAYRDAGYTVQAAGVLGSDTYPKSPGFVPFPGMDPLTEYIANPFLMDDWAVGELFAKSPQYFAALAECINIEPDIIHVEQPWLFPFALRYAKTSATRPVKLLYGSQNVEHGMKYEIVRRYLGNDSAEAAKLKVLQCEVSAIVQADAVCCVSPPDLGWTSPRTKARCVLAANGVMARASTEAGTSEANAISGQRKFALYCASAHPPNMQGFFDIFGNGVGCMAPNESIVIAGNAGTHIVSDRRFAKTAGLSHACIAAGAVSESCLQGLLDTAHAIILPITHGGGTNLKTPEALWAGKHIVATTTAMRGFEQYASAQGVNIADEPAEFLSALRRCMALAPLRLSGSERTNREAVLWEGTLKPLIELTSIL